MNTVHIVDMGAVTALGPGADVLWDGLITGRSGIGTVQRFDARAYTSDKAACIAALDGEPENSRVDGLLDMLCEGLRPVPAGTLLYTASTKAGIDQLERAVRGRPTALNRILGRQVAEVVARRMGITGAQHNISAACASGTVALSLAASHIQQGEADAVMVCGMDLVSEFVFSGFSALQALSPVTCRPFDVSRDGLILGEGAAYILLMSGAVRRQNDYPSLGRIIGWGIASDAHHITAPSREGEGLIRAVHQALDRAGLAAGDITAISAHGTGSVYNDAMELTAFNKLFDPIPPFHSIKGATGHTMGACGLIETIIGVYSLAHQRVPPTVGLDRAENTAHEHVAPSVQSFTGDTFLTSNSGFGGINAAVVLQRSPAL